MPARPRDGKRENFLKLTKIPFTDEFTPAEFYRLQAGLVPQAESDRWFIFFDKNTLNFHRSKTGQGVYQVRLKRRRDGSALVKWAKASKDIIVINKAYEAAILEFLIANLLLGQNISFPLHNKVDEDKPGDFQNMISGTDYPEVTIDKKILKRNYK